MLPLRRLRWHSRRPHSRRRPTPRRAAAPTPTARCPCCCPGTRLDNAYNITASISAIIWSTHIKQYTVQDMPIPLTLLCYLQFIQCNQVQNQARIHGVKGDNGTIASHFKNMSNSSKHNRLLISIKTRFSPEFGSVSKTRTRTLLYSGP